MPSAMLITYCWVFKGSFYASSDTSLSAWETKSRWSPKCYCFRRCIWRSLITVSQLGCGPSSFSSSVENSVSIWSTVELRIMTVDYNGWKQQHCFIITQHAKWLWTRKERISPPLKKSVHVNCLLTANIFSHHFLLKFTSRFSVSQQHWNWKAQARKTSRYFGRLFWILVPYCLAGGCTQAMLNIGPFFQSG